MRVGMRSSQSSVRVLHTHARYACYVAQHACQENVAFFRLSAVEPHVCGFISHPNAAQLPRATVRLCSSCTTSRSLALTARAHLRSTFATALWVQYAELRKPAAGRARAFNFA